MNVLFRDDPHHTTLAPALPGAGVSIARVEVFDEFGKAEPFWRQLEDADALATPYQRYDFLVHWQDHVGRTEGVTPYLVTAFDAEGRPAFLWPLGVQRQGAVRIAQFLGGKHANFNMGLWRMDVAAGIGADGIRFVLDCLARRGDADALILLNQPQNWQGTSNPLALLPHAKSADSGFSGALKPDFDALLRERTSSETRKKTRKKERLLGEQGALTFARAESEADVRRVLETFFAQKDVRLTALGTSNAFKAPGVREFVEAVALSRRSPSPLELYSFSCDGRILATFGGAARGDRFCGMFNSMDFAKFEYSPGELMLIHMVRACCERGLRTFDLGTGEASYKQLFCSDIEPLFDSFLTLTARGRIGAFAANRLFALKRRIKQSDLLWSAVVAFRRFRSRNAVRG